MVIRAGEGRKETREAMRGGRGFGVLAHIAEGIPNCTLFSEITLQPGYSIGRHQHLGNTEVYYVLEGAFVVDDNGETVELRKGDSTVTGGGAYHSLENRSDKPATLLAVIVTE